MKNDKEITLGGEEKPFGEPPEAAEPEPLRTPARADYDAIVDLTIHDAATVAYALVKTTWTIGPGGLERARPPVPLFYDIRDPEKLAFPFKPGSDFWPVKRRTDVVCLGHAWSPDGGTAKRSEASITVGATTKRVAVFGRRVLEWVGRTPRLPEPEPFDAVELHIENAYGGVDLRPPVPDEYWDKPLEFQVDHPGLYARNPYGTGYLATPDPAEGVELPMLEDPDDLLDATKLLGDPARWWERPMPAYLDWTPPGTFPRYAMWLGTDPWFPPPQDETLPEVRKKLLPRDFRDLMHAREDISPHPMFYQEASPGLVLPRLVGGETVVLRGQHPGRPTITFAVPAPPVIRFRVEGRAGKVEAALHHMVTHADLEIVTFVYGAIAPLSRPFIPGVHKEIPVELSVDGDAPIVYEPPPTVRDTVRAASGSEP